MIAMQMSTISAIPPSPSLLDIFEIGSMNYLAEIFLISAS
jgi:hypothetical protein